MILVLFLFLCGGCDRPAEKVGPQYEKFNTQQPSSEQVDRIAIHPLYNPTLAKVCAGVS